MAIDPVEIAVDIVEQYKDELADLKAELESIDGKNLTVTLDVNDNGDIESAKQQLETLEESLNVPLYINLRGVRQAALIKSKLQEDMRTTLNVAVDRENLDLDDISLDIGGENGPPGGGDGGLSVSDIRLGPGATGDDGGGGGGFSDRGAFSFDPIIRREGRRDPLVPFDRDLSFGDREAAFSFMDSIDQSTSSFQRRENKRGVLRGDSMFGAMGSDAGEFFARWDTLDKDASFYRRPDFKSFNTRRDDDLPDVDFGRVGDFFGIGEDSGKSFNKMLGDMKGRLSSVIPSVRTWMNVIAAAIPLLATLAGAAVGTVAALGALAVAGGAIALGGIIAQGDTLQESLRNAKLQARNLREDLYKIFRPVGAQFQPIYERFLDQIPAEAARLTGPARGLASFGGFFSNALTGSVDVLIKLLNATEALEPQIRSIANTFGRFFGDRLIALFKGSVKEVNNNKQAFLNLLRVIEDVVIGGYQLLKVFSFVLSAAAPLFNVLRVMATILSNQVVISLLAGVAASYALYTAIAALGGVLSWLAGSAFVAIISAAPTVAAAIFGITLKVWELVSALSALQVAAGILGVVGGLLAAGYTYNKMQNVRSGPRGSGRNFGRGGGGDTIIIQGDVGRDEYERLKDEHPSMAREFMDQRNATEKPGGS